MDKNKVLKTTGTAFLIMVAGVAIIGLLIRLAWVPVLEGKVPGVEPFRVIMALLHTPAGYTQELAGFDLPQNSGFVTETHVLHRWAGQYKGEIMSEKPYVGGYRTFQGEIECQFLKDGQVVFTTTSEPGKWVQKASQKDSSTATLFYYEAPADVPLREPLELRITLKKADLEYVAPGAGRVRFYVSKHLEY